MTLAFPNPSRNYDASVNCVRFCGHDSAIEVSFFVELAALTKIHPQAIASEAEILSAFDTQIDAIQKAAIKAYKQNKGKYVFSLSVDNF